MNNIYHDNLAEHAAVLEKMSKIHDSIQNAGEIMSQTVMNGGKIMLCGNGGSAADCQHIAAEFMGRFIDDRDPIASLALTTDSSALTCIGNDYSYDNIFSRQVLGLGGPSDCLIGISTSGNSQNVINALEAAKIVGMKTIGMLGRDGGKIANFCDVDIIIPSMSTARIQEMHILVGHTLVGVVESLVSSRF
jgi:D-sedoheptulose 7-phosphate isomerase